MNRPLWMPLSLPSSVCQVVLLAAAIASGLTTRAQGQLVPRGAKGAAPAAKTPATPPSSRRQPAASATKTDDKKAGSAKAKWTVMVYLAADCDLEDAMLGNIEELAQVGSTKDLNILVLADRSPLGEPPADEMVDEEVVPAGDEATDSEAKDEDSTEEDSTEEGPAIEGEEPAMEEAESNDEEEESSPDLHGYTNRAVMNLEDWSGAKLLLIEEGHLREVQDWGETDMGSPQTLENFVRQSQQSFPAEHFILVISDHGNGWQGACHDDSSGKHLTTPDIAKTISRTFTAGKKLDILGFDCCLMGNFEVAHAVSKEVKLFVASEELIPGTGWNYAPWTRLLKNKPATTPLALCEAMADSYRDYFSKADRESAAGITVSVIDTAKLPPLEAALSKLAEALSQQLQANPTDSWRQMARAHAHSTVFAGSLLDIGHFCKNLAEESADETVDAATQETLDALKKAVLHNVVGKRQAEAKGLTLHFPPSVLHEGLENYAKLPFAATPWTKFLQDFSAQGSKEEIPPILRAVKTSTPKVDAMRTAEITSQIDVKNVSHVDFVLAVRDQDQIEILSRIQTGPDVEGNLQDVFSLHWPALMIGEEVVLCPVLRQTSNDDSTDDASPENEDSENEAEEKADAEQAEEAGIYLEAPVHVRRKGTKKWLPVTLVFEASPESDEALGEFLYAVMEDKAGLQDFEFAKGDQVRMIKSKIDAKGKIREVPYPGYEPITIQDPQAFSLVIGGLGEGEFQVGYVAQNLALGAESEYTAVTIEPAKGAEPAK